MPDKLPCQTQDPDLWFPIGNTGPSVAQAWMAKQLCEGCPAIRACLEKAIEMDIQYGIWGGLDEEERKALRTRTGRRPVGSTTMIIPSPRQRSKNGAQA